MVNMFCFNLLRFPVLERPSESFFYNKWFFFHSHDNFYQKQ